MTEIPEHLLKRAQERRAAAGGAAAASGAASTSPAVPDAATPAVAKAAPKAQAPAAPPPPKPDPAYVAAAKSRKKIPFWAMATLSLLPIWGFMYMQGVKPEAKKLSGPLAEGAETYISCSGCHGAAGGGGAGRQLNEGEVVITFPHIEDQLNFVYNGSAGFQLEGVTQYGDPNRAGGVRVPGSFGAVMAGQSVDKGGSYTDAQILTAVCHERYSLTGGADPTDAKWEKEYELWCSPEAPAFLALEEGKTFENLAEEFEGMLPIGHAPRVGTSAG